MKSLFPTSPSQLSDDDLVGLYAYPAERTWVRANFVSTADGAVQGADGRSGSISPTADQRLFAILRSLCDAVLVGAGTARTEGYQRVREEEVDRALRRRHGLTEVPVLAVVSSARDHLPEVLWADDSGLVIVVTPDDGEDRVDVRRVVERLAAHGHRRILCEGGPRLMRQLAASGCLDELCLTISPTLVSGSGFRLTRGELLDPGVPLRLQHVLEEDGALFCRYTRMRG